LIVVKIWPTKKWREHMGWWHVNFLDSTLKHKTHATQPMSRPKKVRDTNQSSLEYKPNKNIHEKLQSKENWTLLRP
jgi:hypothetical protein